MGNSRLAYLGLRRRSVPGRGSRTAIFVLLLLGAMEVGSVCAQVPSPLLRLPLGSEPGATLRFRNTAAASEPAGQAYAESSQEPAETPAALTATRSSAAAAIASPAIASRPSDGVDPSSELRQPSIALSESQTLHRRSPFAAGVVRVKRDPQASSLARPREAQPAAIAPAFGDTPVQTPKVTRLGRPDTDHQASPGDGIREYAGGSVLRAPERRSIRWFLRNPSSQTTVVYPVMAPAAAEAVPMPGQRLAPTSTALARPAQGLPESGQSKPVATRQASAAKDQPLR